MRNSPIASQISNLTMVQRIAMKMITGCFKTTSTVALQYETELLPIELELRKQVTRYLTRIQMVPAKHPTKVCLQEAVRHWRTTTSKTFSSNLEHLVKQYPEYVAENMEEIHPYIKPPWWTLKNTTTHIANIPKEKAKEAHESLIKENNTLNVLHIYTDGSGINGYIGAAAHSPTISAVAHHHLGKADSTNVYAAELTAIHLGVKMASESPEQFDKCYIHVDNQSSIQAIDKPRQQSGQYIIRNILQSLDELQTQRPNLEFKVEWVPGHMDIEGKGRRRSEKGSPRNASGTNPRTVQAKISAGNEDKRGHHQSSQRNLEPWKNTCKATAEADPTTKIQNRSPAIWRAPQETSSELD